MNAIPHPDNGRRCICGQPIYLTPDGWKTRTDNASHPKPRTRRIEHLSEQAEQSQPWPRA